MNCDWARGGSMSEDARGLEGKTGMTWGGSLVQPRRVSTRALLA